MADNLPELAWIADREGWIYWYNKLWYDYTGTTFADMEGWGWQSVHDPEVLPSVMDRWTRSLTQGEPFEMTFPLKGADGRFRPFLTRVRPVRGESGEINCWFGVNTDVSALQSASAELASQKRLLETLNRTAANVAAELSLEALVQSVTDVAVELTGARFGAFFYNVLKDTGESYMLYAISGVPRENFSKFPMPRATAIFQPTFRGVGVVRSGDIVKDPRYGKSAPYNGMPEGHLPVRSYLAAPVMSRQGEVMGGLFFGHPEPDVFSEHHERLVVGLAGQAAIGIDNSRLYEKAQSEIVERKQAEEARLIVLRELNHRVKNLFAVAIGMVGMTARTSATVEEMGEALTGRLRALSRAHELIRSAVTSEGQQPQGTTINAVIASVLEPHVSAGRLKLDGPEVPLGPGGATSLALVLHELATNAAKHGALSRSDGEVAIGWGIEGEGLDLIWVERGGPALAGPPTSKGFGSDLARLSARGQLGGDIAYDWKGEGVEITLRVALKRLAA